MVFDDLNMTHPSDLLLSISFGTAGTIGAPGNLFLVVLITSEYKKRKPHDWLFFLMALNDFFLCVNAAALEAPFILRPQEAGCKFAGGYNLLFGAISYMAPALVAYNRYLSLYNTPLCDRLFTVRNVFISWGIAVTILSLCTSILVVMDGLGKHASGLCGLRVTNNFVAAILVLCCTLTISGCAILVYFTSKVVLKIKQHKKAVSQSAIVSALVNESQEIITALIFSFVVPLFALFPAVAVYLHEWFWPPINPWISRAAVAAFPLAPAVNAYVTTYVVKEYRRKAIRVFKRPAKVSPVAANPERQVCEARI